MPRWFILTLWVTCVVIWPWPPLWLGALLMMQLGRWCISLLLWWEEL